MNWLRILISLALIIGPAFAVDYSLIIPVYADYIYIDDDGLCAGYNPCYKNFSDALASPFIYENTVFYVFNGTYNETSIVFDKGKELIGENGSYVYADQISIIHPFSLYNVTLLTPMFFITGANNSIFNFTLNLTSSYSSYFYLENSSNLTIELRGSIRDDYRIYYRNLSNATIDYRFDLISRSVYRSEVWLANLSNIYLTGNYEGKQNTVFGLMDSLSNLTFKDLFVDSRDFVLRTPEDDVYPGFSDITSINFTVQGYPICVYVDKTRLSKECAVVYGWNISNSDFNLTDVSITVAQQAGYRNRMGSIYGSANLSLSVDNPNVPPILVIFDSQNISVVSASPSTQLIINGTTAEISLEGNYTKILFANRGNHYDIRTLANVTLLSINRVQDAYFAVIANTTNITSGSNITFNNSTSSYAFISLTENITFINSNVTNLSLSNVHGKFQHIWVPYLTTYYSNSSFDNVTTLYAYHSIPVSLHFNNSILGHFYIDAPERYAFNITLQNSLVSGDIAKNPLTPSEFIKLENVSSPSQCEDLIFNTSQNLTCVLYYGIEPVKFSQGYSHNLSYTGYGTYRVVCWEYTRAPNDDFELGNKSNWTISYLYSRYGQIQVVNESLTGNYSLKINITTSYASYRINQTIPAGAIRALILYKSQGISPKLNIYSDRLVGEIYPAVNWSLAEVPLLGKNLSLKLDYKGIYYIDQIIYLTRPVSYCETYLNNYSFRNIVGIHNLTVSSAVEGPFYIENPLFNFTGLLYYDGFEKGPYLEKIDPGKGLAIGGYDIIEGALGKAALVRYQDLQFYGVDALTHGFTLSFWWKAYGDNYYRLWESWSPQSGLIKWAIEDNTLEISLGTPSGTYYLYGSSYPGQWAMYTLVWDPDSAQFSLYINGLLVNSTSTTNSIVPAQILEFNGGAIDELFIFARPLSPQEIQDLYHFVYYPVNVDVTLDGSNVGYGWEGIDRIWINSSLSAGSHIIEVSSPGNSEPSFTLPLLKNLEEAISRVYYGIYNTSFNFSHGDQLLLRVYSDSFNSPPLRNFKWGQISNASTTLVNLTINYSRSSYDYYFGGMYLLPPNANTTNNSTSTLPTIPNGDFETGDLTGWSTGGDADWYVQDWEVYEGDYAAESDVEEGELSWIETTIDLNTTADLVFAWNLEISYYSEARVYVDGDEKIVEWDDTNGWEVRRITLSPGTHTITWEWEKIWDPDGWDTIYLDWVHLEEATSSTLDSPNTFTLNNFTYQGLTEFYYNVNTTNTWLEAKRGYIVPLFNIQTIYLPTSFLGDFYSLYLSQFMIAKGQNFIKVENVSYMLATGCKVFTPIVNNSISTNSSIIYTLTNYENDPATCKVYVNNNLVCEQENLTSGTYTCDPGLGEGEIVSFNITCEVGNNTCSIPLTSYQYFSWLDDNSTARVIYQVNISKGYNYLTLPHNFTSAGDGYFIALINSSKEQAEAPFRVISVDNFNITLILESPENLSTYLLLYLRNSSPSYTLGQVYNASTLSAFATNTQLHSDYIVLYPNSSLNLSLGGAFVIVGALQLLTPPNGIANYTSNSIYIGSSSIQARSTWDYHIGRLYLINSSGNAVNIPFTDGYSSTLGPAQFSRAWYAVHYEDKLGTYIDEVGEPVYTEINEASDAAYIHVSSPTNKILLLAAIREILILPSLSRGTATIYYQDMSDYLYIVRPLQHQEDPRVFYYVSSQDRICDPINISEGYGYHNYDFNLGWYNWTLTCENIIKTGNLIKDAVEVTFLGPTTINSTHALLNFSVSTQVNNYVGCYFENINTSSWNTSLGLVNAEISAALDFALGTNIISYQCWTIGSLVTSGLVNVTTDFPPEITIVSPANNTTLSSSILQIQVNVSDENISQVSCDIYLNQTFLTSFNNTTSFIYTYYLPEAGYYLLNVSCTDGKSTADEQSYFIKTGVGECYSCEQCNEMLQEPVYSGVIVKVNLNVPAYLDACIYLNNSKSVSCENAYIYGNENQSGIIISSDGSLQGCGFYGLGAGINITAGTPQILQVNSSNNVYGLYIAGGNANVQLSRFTFNQIDVYNISASAGTSDICNTYYQWSEDGHPGCAYTYPENTTPNITILEPELYVNASTFIVSFEAYDEYSQTLDCNIFNQTTITVERGTVVNATVSIPDVEGNHSFWIECEDLSNNKNLAIHAVIYDKTPPAIIVYSPPQNATFVGNSVLFNFTVIDDANVTCEILNYSFNLSPNETIEQYLLFEAGTHTVKIVCWDSAQNMNSTNLSFEVSNSYINITPSYANVSIETGNEKTLTFNISPQLVSSLSNVILSVEDCPYTSCTLYPSAFSTLDSLQSFNLTIKLPLGEDLNDERIYIRATENTYYTVLLVPVDVDALSPSLRLYIPSESLPLEQPINVSYVVENDGESPYYNISASVSCPDSVMCDIADPLPTTLLPGENTTLNLTIYLPYNYTYTRVTPELAWSSHVGTSYYRLTVPVSQPSLVAPRFDMLVSNVTSYLTYNVVNLGKTPAIGVIATVACPAGYLCNISPIAFDVYDNVSLTFGARQTTAINDDTAIVTMRDIAGRTWTTLINLHISKPKLELNYTPTTLSYGLSNITLIFNNTGEKESLNATIFAQCSTTCVPINDTLPSIMPNQTYAVPLEVDLPESYMDTNWEANITVMEENGRAWNYKLTLHVPQPQLEWNLSSTILPKNTSILEVNITNIGDYALTDATLGIVCPSLWVCSNITNVSLAPGETTTAQFTITIPGQYYSSSAQLTFYARTPFKYLPTNATFSVLQPAINASQPYIVVAPGESISSYVNITNIGNWTLEMPTLSLDLVPPVWNVTLDSFLPSLAPNQTAPVNFTVYVSPDDTLTQRSFRILITDIYGIVWYTDVWVNVKQPDINISYEPPYLDIGDFNLTLNITNNGTLELIDVTPSLICLGTTAYLTNATVVSLYPNESVSFGAYINVKSQPQECILYLYNENRTISKNISFYVKRLNLAIAHDIPSSVPVGYSQNHTFNLTNLEPYAVNLTAYVSCWTGCDSQYLITELLPNQTTQIVFNLTVPITYSGSKSNVTLHTLYRGLIDTAHVYSFDVIQPSISISAVPEISMVNSYAGTFTVINRGIPVDATVMLLCPAGLACETNETEISLEGGETRDIFFNISVIGAVNEEEVIYARVSTPSLNFTRSIRVLIDRGISASMEEKTLYPGTTNNLTINITNLRPTSTEVTCMPQCPSLWGCSLNETTFNLTTNYSILLQAIIPYQELSNAANISLECTAHNITSLITHEYEIYQPQPNFILHSHPINFGENTVLLEIQPDSNFVQDLSLVASCDVQCSLNETSVRTNETQFVSLNLTLPDNYTLPYVNVSITITDGARTYVIEEQLPTNITSLYINTQLAYYVPRGQYTNIPIQVINVGLVNATNATMSFSCNLVSCNATNITFNLSARSAYSYDLWVYKGYEIEEGFVDVKIIHENQIFMKRLFVRPLLPQLFLVANRTWTSFQNTTLTIPFTIENKGNDTAVSLNASISCPIGIECNLSFMQGYNLLPGQSRSGSIEVAIPEDQLTPIYLTLTASEASLSASWTFNITPEVMPTFETIAPKFVPKQTYQVNASALTLLDINGTNRVVFANASGIYYITPAGIYQLFNESIDAMDSGYFDEDAYLDLAIAQGNQLYFLYSSANFSKVYNFSTVFPIIALTAFDGDGDGKEDLALATSNNQLAIYLNNGSRFIKNASIDINAISLTAYDYDQDGKGDIVAGDPIGQINFIRYPYSNITIITPNLHSNPNARVAMGDVYASNFSVVIVGDGLGELEYLRMYNNSFIKHSLGYFNITIQDLVSYDFEGDGDLDIVLSDGENISFWEVQSQIIKYVKAEGETLRVTTTIINPFLSTMKNVTLEDYWNPGEVSFPTYRRTYINYVSATTSYSESRRQSDVLWTGRKVEIPTYLDMEPFSVLRITYYLEKNTSTPVYYGPKVSYQRVPPHSDNLPVLVSDHIKHTPPYHVINPLYGDLVNVVDGGAVTGNMPDYVLLDIHLKDASYYKYVTSLEDPNACLELCSPYDWICIKDPSNRKKGQYYLMAYTSHKPYISSTLVEEEPVYGSLIFAQATVANFGETAAQGDVAFYLNNLRYLDYLYNLSVNDTRTYPSRPSPDILPYGYPVYVGENSIKVVIDPNNLMSELNKSNNIKVKSFNVTKYADYVINDVYLGDKEGNRLTAIGGGFDGYIVVNVSNLGNADGYVFLNASINGSEFYSGEPVGTNACDYGRMPYRAYVPANSSKLVMLGPVHFVEYGAPVNLTLAVSIYPHIRGYPEDINLSNNLPRNYTFQVVPSPPELDFYNSTKVGDPTNYTLRPNPPYNEVKIDWVEPGKVENISLYAWNLGGAPVAVNVSVYQDVFTGGEVIYNYTYGLMFDYYNASIWDGLTTPVYNQEVTLPPGKTQINLTTSFNFTHDTYHNLVIVLDRVGDEDNLSNIYILHYIPPDLHLRASLDTNPLPGSIVRVDYNLSVFSLQADNSDVGVIRGSRRYSTHISYASLYRWYNYSPAFNITVYLNHTPLTVIPYSENTLATRRDSSVAGSFTFQVPGDYESLQLDMIADEERVLGDIDYTNNIRNVTLTAPHFANFSIEVKDTQLLTGTFNLLHINITETNDSCGNIDHLAIYLKDNDKWYLLYSAGEFARSYGYSSWLRVCGSTLYTPIVYVPNITSTDVQIYVYVLSGYKITTPEPISETINITLPAYDKLWYVPSTLPLKVNSAPVLIRENYPHVGSFPAGVPLEVNQPLTLYLYREFLYNKSITLVHEAPIEVRIS